MTTYTIINSDGEMLETGLTLRDAAAEVVSHGRFAATAKQSPTNSMQRRGPDNSLL